MAFHSTAEMSSKVYSKSRTSMSGCGSIKRSLPSEEEFQVDDSATVREKIAKIYAERLLSDITLLVGGNSYPAHRLILCASSDVFQVMLMNPNWSESQETTVVLQEDPACAKVFADFLKYLYTGEILINHYSVLPLLTLADKYNVKDMIHRCLDYMECHLLSAAAHGQLISWLQYTLYCGHEKVASCCQNFVKWNFEMVANGADFENMEMDVLISFLQCSDLVVYHEMAVFQCVALWLSHQENRLESQAKSCNDKHSWLSRFKHMVCEVMSHVRFPMLSPRQLADLLLSPLIRRFQGFFFEKMADAMAFHSPDKGTRAPRLIQTSEGRLHTTPRLYTTETWGALLAIEDYNNFPTYAARTLLFSSPAGLSEAEAEPAMEWSVDLYPKGVWFKKLYLIAWHGTVELPESTIQSVRLSVSSRTNQECRTSVGILLYGVKDGIEYVRSVVQKTFVFSDDERVLNIDHVVPYDELNGSLTHQPFHRGVKTDHKSFTYLVGTRNDVFKMHVMLLPAPKMKP